MTGLRIGELHDRLGGFIKPFATAGGSLAIRIPQYLPQFRPLNGADMMAWTPAKTWHMLKHIPEVCDEL